jgi:hypothetical protein
MSWEPRVPAPWDFCGRIPCPRCYVWADSTPNESIMKWGEDLLGAVAATTVGLDRLGAAAAAFHEEGVRLKDAPSEEPPDTGATFDLGIPCIERIERSFSANRKTPPVPPRPLNCDDIAVRQAAREKEQAEKKESLAEKVKEAREILAACKEVEKEEKRDDRARVDNAYLSAPIPAEFIQAAQMRGMSLSQAVDEWQRLEQQRLEERPRADSAPGPPPRFNYMMTWDEVRLNLDDYKFKPP